MARILIADDDADVLESMIMQLEVLGHDAVGVQDPDEMLMAAEEVQPDLILQDLRMGSISLAGLVANLRTHPATADVPLVFFSANPQLPSLARKYGAWGYLPKPFTQRQLAEVLEQFLGEEAAPAGGVGIGQEEVASLFHDTWNTLAAINNYVYVVARQEGLSPKAQRAVEAVQGLLLKLEAQTERLRASVETLAPELAPPSRPPRPARRAAHGHPDAAEHEAAQ